MPALHVESLREGQAVEFAMRDGMVMQGTFLGLEPVPAEVYRGRWQDSLQQLLGEATLPPLRSRVRLRLTNERETEVEFVGVDLGHLSVVATEGGRVERFAFEKVAALSFGNEGRLEGTTLFRLVNEGRLPLLHAASLKFPGGVRAVRIEDIRSAAIVTPGSRGKLTGLVLGAVVDTLIVVTTNNSLDGAWGKPYCPPNDPSCISCPLVYSHDGRRFVLDAEPLGASLFAADEATDQARLSHLVAVDGAYRVRIRNEMQEVEHLDAVRLLAVDHMPGDEIVPDMNGRLHALRAPVAPVRAYDLRSGRLDALLAAEDGRAWVGIPLARSPGAERDVVEVEFERPPGTRAATLAFSLRATAWGSRVFAHLLRLQGRGMDAFWARMETDREARREFRGAWAREALPRVSVWTGQDWRLDGVLAHIPIAVPGRRALRVDLDGIEGSTLRVRVEGMPGLWAFDRVVADFGPEKSLDVERLRLSQARSADGEDVMERIGRSDDARLTLLPMSGWVDLAFEARSQATGTVRSLVLEVEGYYRPVLPAEGDPQTALFDRMLREPGALTRYVLAGAEAETRVALREAATER